MPPTPSSPTETKMVIMVVRLKTSPLTAPELQCWQISLFILNLKSTTVDLHVKEFQIKGSGEEHDL